MRALTVVQPYAELIASGIKRVENRTWETRYRGPLAIHAGKATRYDGESVFDIARDHEVEPTSLKFGAVIAIANLVDCVHHLSSFWSKGQWDPKVLQRHPWIADHAHAQGPWCWILSDVRRIDPVSTAGARMLWEWTPPPGVE